MTAAVWGLRLAAVIGLLVGAALLATPKGRLPLAMRGLAKVLRRDGRCASAAAGGERPSAARRALAFLFVILAVLVAVL